MEVPEELPFVSLPGQPGMHLRAYLRSCPAFDPTVPLQAQPSLRARWAKAFWDIEEIRHGEVTTWHQYWTTLATPDASSSIGTSPRGQLSRMLVADPWRIPSLEWQIKPGGGDGDGDGGDGDGDGDEPNTMATMTLVASGQINEEIHRRFQTRTLPREIARAYRSTLDHCLSWDRFCVESITRRLDGLVSANLIMAQCSLPRELRLHTIVCHLDDLLAELGSRALLNGQVEYRMRPLCIYVEAHVQEEHQRQDTFVVLLDGMKRLHGLLETLYVSLPNGERIISDRLIHTFVHRLCVIREAALTQGLSFPSLGASTRISADDIPRLSDLSQPYTSSIIRSFPDDLTTGTRFSFAHHQERKAGPTSTTAISTSTPERANPGKTKGSRLKEVRLPLKYHHHQQQSKATTFSSSSSSAFSPAFSSSKLGSSTRFSTTSIGNPRPLTAPLAAPLAAAAGHGPVTARVATPVVAPSLAPTARSVERDEASSPEQDGDDDDDDNDNDKYNDDDKYNDNDSDKEIETLTGSK